MAGPTQAFEVRIIIGTPMSLSLDVVNGLSSDSSTAAKAVLTQVIVTFKDTRSLIVPLTTIAARVPALAMLVLQPSLIAMLLTISQTISGGARAPSLTTAAGNQCRHRSPLTLDSNVWHLPSFL